MDSDIRNAYSPMEQYRADLASLLYRYKRDIGMSDKDFDLSMAFGLVDEFIATTQHKPGWMK